MVHFLIQIFPKIKCKAGICQWTFRKQGAQWDSRSLRSFLEEEQLGLSVEGHVGANGRGHMQRSTSAELRTCASCFHMRSNPHKVETEAWGPDGSRDPSVWEPGTGDPQSDMRRYPGRHPGWREGRTLLQVKEVRREATAQEALSGQEQVAGLPNRTLPRGLPHPVPLSQPPPVVPRGQLCSPRSGQKGFS